MAKISSSEELIKQFQTQLDHRWRRFRNINADDSSRGSSYETAFKKLMERYFQGRYDFLTNCSVMDHTLSCFDAFEENAQNEVDIVALFPSSTPRIIIREEDIKWVPLEGAGFICEIKSQIDKNKLQSDLRKLEILRELEKTPSDRFSTTISGDLTVDHQLHCLVYDKASIAGSTMSEIIEPSEAWDLILIVENNLLIINETLPAANTMMDTILRNQLLHPQGEIEGTGRFTAPEHDDRCCISVDNGLAWFILALSVSIPIPLGTLTIDTFFSLVQESLTDLSYGPVTEINEENRVELERVDPDEE